MDIHSLLSSLGDIAFSAVELSILLSLVTSLEEPGKAFKSICKKQASWRAVVLTSHYPALCSLFGVFNNQVIPNILKQHALGRLAQ